MFCHRFVRTTPGDTALTRIGSQFNRRGTGQGFDSSTDTRGDYPAALWAPAADSSCEDNGAALSNLWTFIFDRRKYRPIAQFKCSSSLLEIRNSKLVQLQAIARSEKLGDRRHRASRKGFPQPFRPARQPPVPCTSSDAVNGFLNSFCCAGDDHNLGSLRCRLFGDCRPNPRRPTYDNHPLILETAFSCH
jgi:hypothetical protein